MSGQIRQQLPLKCFSPLFWFRMLIVPDMVIWRGDEFARKPVVLFNNRFFQLQLEMLVEPGCHLCPAVFFDAVMIDDLQLLESLASQSVGQMRAGTTDRQADTSQTIDFRLSAIDLFAVQLILLKIKHQRGVLSRL